MTKRVNRTPPMKLFLLVFSFAVSLLHAEETLRTSTTGFYPVWENTGNVEKGGQIRLGLSDAEVGIADRAQVGMNPVVFAYRIPNGYLKINLGRTGVFKWSAQTGFYYLLEQASRSSMSPMYVSRLDNPDFTMLLIPTSLNNTVAVFDWLELHQSFTLLPEINSGRLANKVFGGYSVVAELLPQGRHGLLFHLGEVGIWEHDFSLVGASYRYRNAWMEFRLGYFYRIQKVGTQSAPLASISFLL